MHRKVGFFVIFMNSFQSSTISQQSRSTYQSCPVPRINMLLPMAPEITQPTNAPCPFQEVLNKPVLPRRFPAY